MWPNSIFSLGELILAGLFVGVLVAAPVGPVNVVCIQRTLERGFWGGFAAGLGAVLADGLIATFATFGISAISGVMHDHQYKIQLIGGAVLMVFGLKIYFTKPKIVATATTTLFKLRRMVELVPAFLRPTLRFRIWRIVPHLSIVPQTFFLTITNPGAILGLFAIVGGLGSVIGGINNHFEALTLVFSVMAGSLLWWAGISRLISRLRHRLTEARLKVINQVAGVVLVAFGMVLFTQLAWSFAGHYSRIAFGALRPSV
jgi:threonine/homoserine/homoserine lactone efflux protein